jgi:hemerythrin-like domain-containing protein
MARSIALIDQLRSEHALIETVAGSLRTFARRRIDGDAPPGDAAGFLRFFRVYAGEFHHAREEGTLFVALRSEAELPGDRGPIAALTADHREMAGLLDRMSVAQAAGPVDGAAFRAAALEYSERLWHHIDAEDSVLLPESEARLLRLGVAAELPTLAASPEQLAARAAGERLVAAYPPAVDRDVFRGDGCIVCPAYGRSCEGLEREWWSESEWAEFEDHLPSG